MTGTKYHEPAFCCLLRIGPQRAARNQVRAVLERAASRPWIQVSFVDALEYRLPLLDKMHKEYPAGAAPDPLPELADIIRVADGFMIVSGEYNHSIPPALKNLLDHFLEEWFWRPSAIACYSAGAFGGVRAAMQLRATLAELGMPSIPSIHPMPKVQDQFEDDGTPRDPGHVRRVGRFLDEFEWYAKALKRARAEGVPY